MGERGCMEKRLKRTSGKMKGGGGHKLEGTNNSRHINVESHIPSRSTSGEAKGCIKAMLDDGHVGLNESQ